IAIALKMAQSDTSPCPIRGALPWLSAQGLVQATTRTGPVPVLTLGGVLSVSCHVAKRAILAVVAQCVINNLRVVNAGLEIKSTPRNQRNQYFKGASNSAPFEFVRVLSALCKSA